MKQHPVHALLTPDPADVPLPTGATSVRLALGRGLPAPLQVPGLGLSVLLSAPTARVRAWLDAETNLDAYDSADDRLPRASPTVGPVAPIDARSRLAPVLIAVQGMVPIAVMPLIVNASVRLPRSAGTTGIVLELTLRGFLITAEAMRGPGAGASFVELAWRRLEGGANTFMAPVARDTVRTRLMAVTGEGHKRKRRRIDAEFLTGTAGAADLRGGLNWRLTHD